MVCPNCKSLDSRFVLRVEFKASDSPVQALALNGNTSVCCEHCRVSFRLNELLPNDCAAGGDLHE